MVRVNTILTLLPLIYLSWSYTWLGLLKSPCLLKPGPRPKPGQAKPWGLAWALA
ncbi:hypothetical protein B0H17DRAFT_1101137 [Mycena rosella]|uniref:Uncharacterized protein n=1 Tax=Mycena rosella TaxID=1033263 RepID=A0AAD7CM84_MYCRO|nr:hypothetical protein B0H17DRAFT_1101137 [Mycena rosella]